MRTAEVAFAMGTAPSRGDVSVDTMIFYAGNLAAVSTYVILMALIMRPKGFMGNGAMPTPVVALGVLFLASCIMLHLELAYSGFTGERIVEYGVVDIHFLVLAVLKPILLTMWIFVAARGRRGREDELVIEGFERRAQDAITTIESHAEERATQAEQAAGKRDAEKGR